MRSLTIWRLIFGFIASMGVMYYMKVHILGPMEASLAASESDDDTPVNDNDSSSDREDYDRDRNRDNNASEE